MLTKVIGKNVQKYREQKGWTIKDLSQMSHVSANHLSQIESGKKGVSIDTLEKLSEVLGVSVQKFLDVNNDVKNKATTHQTIQAHDDPDWTYEYARRDERIKLTFAKGTPDETMERRIAMSVRATFNSQSSVNSQEDAPSHVVNGDTVES